MKEAIIQDRIHRGLGVAARVLGSANYAFRPRGIANPIAIGNRYLTLAAAFNPQDDRFRHAGGYSQALWHGIFDAAYTKPGDYLVGPAGTYFIVAQQQLLPVLCVVTNRTVTLSRPMAQLADGVNPYGGVQRATAQPILIGWPGNLLDAGSGRGDLVGLPGDAMNAMAKLLLPPLPDAAMAPRVADLMTDDLGRNWTVGAAEQGLLGWRLSLKQASS
jgi:hypothetical protein